MGLFDWWNGSDASPTLSPQQYMQQARAQAGQRALMDLGLGLMAAGGPSREPTSLAQAFGRSGLNASQGYSRGLQNAVAGGIGMGQLQKFQSDLDASNAWKKAFGLTDTPLAQAQTPGVTAAALTTPEGERAGPTPQAAGRLATISGMQPGITPTETGTGYGTPNLPANMRQFVGLMGPERGSAFLAQQAAKDMERGVFVPETRTIEGKEVQGQRDRLSGKWSPLDPATTKLSLQNNLVGPQAGEVQSAKDLSEIGKGYYTKAQTAREQNRDFQNMKLLLNKGVETGFGTETKMGISRAAKGLFGIDLDPKLSDQEMFGTLAGGMAVGAQPQGQGAVSNYERELFQKAVVNLGRTTEGNKKLIDWYSRIKKQDADIGQLYEKELEDNGRVTPGFLKKVREHYEKPLFSKEEMEEMQKLGSAAPAPKQSGGKNLPVPGAIEDGFRFKGGNPADPMSWEKVQ